MCRLLYVLLLLHLACVQYDDKISTSPFVRLTSASLYEALEGCHICMGDCANQALIIYPINKCFGLSVRNQSLWQKGFLKTTHICQQKYCICCDFNTNFDANIPETLSIFRTCHFRVFISNCVHRTVPDIVFKQQFVDLCAGTKPDIIPGCDKLKSFAVRSLVFCKGKQTSKYIKYEYDVCNILLTLTTILLSIFRQRFTLCILGFSQLIIGVCCSFPDPFHIFTSNSGETKFSHKTSNTTTPPQASMLFQTAGDVGPLIQDKTSRSLKTEDSQSTAVTHAADSQENNSQATANLVSSIVSGSMEFVNVSVSGPTKRQDLWKRSVQSNSSTKISSPPARSCTLHLVADHLFFRQVGSGNVLTTVNMMKDVIRGADAVFRGTDFDQDGVGDNIGFLIQNITVIQSYPSYYFPHTAGSADYLQYLRNFSTADHSQYCLAIVFTNLQFQRGVWGVSWMASSSYNANPGGICQKRIYSQQDSAFYSFNTVAITFTNNGQWLSRDAAVRVLSHELGHSFGSWDDDDITKSCSLSSTTKDTYGAYMMNQYSTTGLLPNHYRFSPCSLRLMYPVIVRKATCLLDHQSSHCGNGVVEDGEECDCGNSDLCHYNDPCCTPGDVSNHSTDQPCTVRKSRGKVCSPLASSCCLSNCQVNRNSSVVCDKATECHEYSLCDGHSGKCPNATIKPNGTLCRGGSHFCVEGQCVGSVCQTHGFLSCHCTNPLSNRCKLCCKASSNSECLPAENHGILNEQGLPIYLTLGEPCSDVFPAFCDERHVCVPHLKEPSASFFIETSTEWFIRYWPYLLFFLLVLLLAIIFKVSALRLKNAHARSLQYGKMTGIFKIACCIGVHNMQNIAVTRYLFDRFQKKAAKGKLHMYSIEAISRLRTFFPTCPLSHIVTAVNMGSSEDVVVRVLLAQGFPFRRFIPQLIESEFAHLAHLFPRTGSLFGDRPSVASEESIHEVSELHHRLFIPSDSTHTVRKGFLQESSSRSVHTVSTSSIVEISSEALERKDHQLDRAYAQCSDMKMKSSDFCASYLQHFKTELSESRHLLEGVVKADSLTKENIVYGRSRYDKCSMLKKSSSKKTPYQMEYTSPLPILQAKPLLQSTLSSVLTSVSDQSQSEKEYLQKKTSSKQGMIKSIQDNLESGEKPSAVGERDAHDVVHQNDIEEDRSSQVDAEKEREDAQTSLGTLQMVMKDAQEYLSVFTSWFGQGIPKEPPEKIIHLEPNQGSGQFAQVPVEKSQQDYYTSSVDTEEKETSDHGKALQETQHMQSTLLSERASPQPGTSQHLEKQNDASTPGIWSQPVILRQLDGSFQMKTWEDLGISVHPGTAEPQYGAFQQTNASSEPRTSKPVTEAPTFGASQQSLPDQIIARGSYDSFHSEPSTSSMRKTPKTTRVVFRDEENTISSTNMLGQHTSSMELTDLSHGMDFVDIHMERLPQPLMLHRGMGRNKKNSKKAQKLSTKY